MDDQQMATQVVESMRVDSKPLQLIFNELYHEIKAQCHAIRSQTGISNRTLNTTGTVHETYIRLSQNNPEADFSPQHLLRLTAMVTKQLIVDYFRQRFSAKRGSDYVTLSLENLTPEDKQLLVSDYSLTDLLSFNDLTDQLYEKDPRMADVVLLKVFGGLTFDECSAALSISVATVKRDWKMAQAMFLADESLVNG